MRRRALAAGSNFALLRALDALRACKGQGLQSRAGEGGQKGPTSPKNWGASKIKAAMSSLEIAVKRLAGALDALESKLDDRLSDLKQGEETMAAARIKARTAKIQAAAAAEDLSDAIRDLKTLIGGESSAKEG